MCNFKRMTTNLLIVLTFGLMSSCNTAGISLDESFQNVVKNFQNSKKISKHRQSVVSEETKLIPDTYEPLPYKSLVMSNQDYNIKSAISNYPSVRESIENLFVAKQSIAIAEALGKGQSSVTLSVVTKEMTELLIWLESHNSLTEKYFLMMAQFLQMLMQQNIW